jgi:hypothetical protein
MSRPRAADDFASIRARMEELRREREHTVREDAMELRRKVYRQVIREAVLRRNSTGAAPLWRSSPEDC